MSHIQAHRPFTGWHMAGIMILFFSVIIGVNVYFTVVAARSWTGQVVDDSYASGQDFNEKVHRAQEQAALGWHATLTYREGALRFDLRDAANNPVGAAGATAAVTRPLGDAQDQRFALAPGSDGALLALAKLPPGVWNVVVTIAQTPHGAYEHHEQLIVP